MNKARPEPVLLPLDMNEDLFVDRGSFKRDVIVQLVFEQLFKDHAIEVAQLTSMFKPADVAELALRCAVTQIDHYSRKVCEYEGQNDDYRARLIDGICNELRRQAALTLDEVVNMLIQRATDAAARDKETSR